MDALALEILESFPKACFDKGECIIRQGERVTRVFYLTEGHAIRSGVTSGGDVLTYGERHAGDGASCLLGGLAFYSSGRIHDTSFFAKTPCTCRVVPGDDFRKFLFENPEVMDDLLHLAIANYEFLNANYRGKMRGLAPERVARYLLRHSEANQSSLDCISKLNVSAIARDVGIHRLTVGKIIRSLADLGVVSFDGNSLVVESRTRLESFANGVDHLDYR